MTTIEEAINKLLKIQKQQPGMQINLRISLSVPEEREEIAANENFLKKLGFKEVKHTTEPYAGISVSGKL